MTEEDGETVEISQPYMVVVEAKRTKTTRTLKRNSWLKSEPCKFYRKHSLKLTFCL